MSILNILGLKGESRVMNDGEHTHSSASEERKIKGLLENYSWAGESIKRKLHVS